MEANGDLFHAAQHCWFAEHHGSLHSNSLPWNVSMRMSLGSSRQLSSSRMNSWNVSMLMLTNRYLNTAARSLIFSDLTSWLEQSLCTPFLFVNIHPHNCGVCGCVCSMTATSLYRRVSCTNYNDNEIRCWGPAAKLRENTIPCPWLMVHLSMTPCIKIPFP